jgi:hypothetical protein
VTPYTVVFSKFGEAMNFAPVAISDSAMTRPAAMKQAPGNEVCEGIIITINNNMIVVAVMMMMMMMMPLPPFNSCCSSRCSAI